MALLGAGAFPLCQLEQLRVPLVVGKLVADVRQRAALNGFGNDVYDDPGVVGRVGRIRIADLLSVADAGDELLPVEPLDVVDLRQEPAEFRGKLGGDVLGLAGLDPFREGRQRRASDAQGGLPGVESCTMLDFADEVVVLHVRRFTKGTKERRASR